MNKTTHTLTDSLITVVIAAYNVEDYIQSCLESVINQTYTNLEIIVVNDGSTDNTKSIVDRLSQQDSRIQLLSIKNSGAATARNLAIDVAKGDYISIIDSDDTVETSFIKDLHREIVATGADISVCEFFYSYNNATHSRPRITPSTNQDVNIKILNRDEVLRDFLLEKSIMQPVFWNKLYKTSLLKDTGINIPEGGIYEDSRVLYKFYHHIERVVYSSKPLYYYLQRDDSVMGRKVRPSDIKLLREMVAETHLWFSKKYGNKYNPELFAYETGVNMNIVNFMVDKQSVILSEWTTSTSFIRRNIKKIIKAKNISTKRKIGSTATLLGPYLYSKIRKVI